MSQHTTQSFSTITRYCWSMQQPSIADYAAIAEAIWRQVSAQRRQDAAQRLQ